MIEKYYTASRTKPRLINTLYFISMMRYITFNQLKSVKKPHFQHIATKKSLQKLIRLQLIIQKPSTKELHVSLNPICITDIKRILREVDSQCI